MAKRRGRATTVIALATAATLLATTCSADPSSIGQADSAATGDANRPTGTGGRMGTGAPGSAPCEPVAAGRAGTAGTDRPLVVWHSVPTVYRAAFEADVAEWARRQGDLAVQLLGFNDTGEILTRFDVTDPDERPDLLLASEVTLASMAESGLFTSAAACAEATGAGATGAALPDGLLGPAVATWSYGDEWWGVPFLASTPVLYANLQVLADAGITSLPDTPEGFGAALDQLARANGRPGFLFDDNLPAVLVEQWTARVGEPLVSDPLGAPIAELAGPVALGALRAMADIVAAGLARQSGELQAQAILGVYSATEPTGFGIGSSAGLGVLRSSVASGVLAAEIVGVGALPLPGEGSLIGGGAWWLTLRPGADPRLAFALASWLSTPAIQAALAANTGYLPVHVDAPAEPVLDEAWRAFPALRVAWDQVQPPIRREALAGLQVGPRVQLRQQLGGAFVRARQGTDPGVALGEADAVLQTLLDAWARTRSGAPAS